MTCCQGLHVFWKGAINIKMQLMQRIQWRHNCQNIFKLPSTLERPYLIELQIEAYFPDSKKTLLQKVERDFVITPWVQMYNPKKGNSNRN